MNVYIMTDIEGISGVYTKAQVSAAEAKYAEGRAYMTREVNICASACKSAGVDKVYVHDCHGSGSNLYWDRLSSDIDGVYIGGAPDNRFHDVVKECDGVILLGYHAMAGTRGAVLEHTFNSLSIQNIWINDVAVGEIAIDAGILGDMGIPVIMVAGDDKACLEAKSFLPNVVTAEVKRGSVCMGALLLPPEKAEAIIRASVAEAIANIKNAKPLIFEKPIRMRFERTERTPLPKPCTKPFMEILDGRSYVITGDDVESTFFRGNS